MCLVGVDLLGFGLIGWSLVGMDLIAVYFMGTFLRWFPYCGAYLFKVRLGG